MNSAEIEQFILNKPKAVKEFPFGPETAVYKVCGKMFALISENRINLKCEPDEASALRANFPEISPGYHMNKAHWNTLDLSGNLSEDLIIHCLDESYRLVVSSLKKSDQATLLQM